MVEYRLSVLAEQDLADILDYTWEEFGEDQAFSYLGELKNRLSMLAANPSMAAERKEFVPPVRLFPSGGHTIIYMDHGDHIWVVRILHRRMDVKRHL